MGTILERIVEERRRALVERKEARPEGVLRAELSSAPPPRDFARALARPGIQVIAEIKRASPSAGVIRADCDPATIARAYRDAGAAAISVLTEPNHFRGSLADLRAVRAAVHLPLLRKDFIIDPYQLVEARAAGADAVLLIAACLSEADLRALLREAAGLGLAALVEVHTQGELDRALAADARIVGINNRDLATFEVDLAVTERLAAENDLGGRVVVSESGIRSRADLQRLAACGVDAVLVGTVLMREADPGGALRRLLAPAAGAGRKRRKGTGR